MAVLAIGAGRATGLSGVHVETPKLEPTTSLPAPQVPQLPSTNVPSLPSAPSVPSAPSLPSAPSVKTAPVAPSAGTGTGSGSGSGSGSAPSTSGTSGRSSAPAAGGYAPSAGSGARASRFAPLAALPAHERVAMARALRRHVSSERQFRSQVKELAGCMGAASPLGRRVLTLRAGLGGRSPRSRERVAHRLGLSKKRVARIEHRSLRRLRSANAASGCGSGASAPRPAAAGPAAPTGTSGGSALLAPAGGLKGNPVTHGAVLGASASSPPEPHSSVPTKLRSAGARLASTLDDQTARTGFALAILAALVAGVMIGAGTRFRRRAAPAPPAATVYPRWYVDPFERPEPPPRAPERPEERWVPPPPPSPAERQAQAAAPPTETRRHALEAMGAAGAALVGLLLRRRRR